MFSVRLVKNFFEILCYVNFFNLEIVYEGI